MGHFIILMDRKDLNYFEGDYMDDNIEGIAKVQRQWLDWDIFLKRILNGFCRGFSAKTRLNFTRVYANGKQIGICWKLIDTGGCIVGKVDKGDKLSGQDIVYILPDLMTALVDGVLICGQQINGCFSGQ